MMAIHPPPGVYIANGAAADDAEVPTPIPWSQIPDAIARKLRSGILPWPAGTTDHGALTGLPDDDHPQYAKVAAGAFTTAPLSSAATPVGSTDVARLQEVGDAIVTMAFYVDTNAVAKTASNAIFNAALLAGEDQVPYFVDTGNAAQMTVTTFARTLLDDNDAATARTTLGANVIDDSGFAGSLLGSGVTSLQALADWIDANVVVLP